MANFSYWAYTVTGETVTGEVPAANQKEAAEILHRRGLLAYRTSELRDAARSKPATLKWLSQRPLGAQRYAAFARQLATLTKADLPLDQSLRLVAAESERTAVGKLALQLAESVTAGRSLSASIELTVPDAPPFMSAMIRAGEARGKLGPCLNDLADILERRIEVQSRIRSALAYPAFLMLVALFAIVIVVGKLVPTLIPIFVSQGVPAPPVLEFADTVGQTISNHWPAILGCLALMTAAAAWLVRRPQSRLAFSRYVIRVPVVGKLIQRLNVAVIARTLGTLLRNGVPLVTALQLAITVTSNTLFRAALEDAGQAVKEGQRLSAALRRADVLPEVALKFIAIGEQSSRLDEMLLHLADIEDAQTTRLVNTLLVMLPPAITIVMGGLIGGLIVTVVQALTSINRVAL